MNGSGFTGVANGVSVGVGEVPMLDAEELRGRVRESLRSGLRVCAFFAAESADDGLTLWAVLADDEGGELRVGRGALRTRRFESLTPEFPQMHLVEREMAEQFHVEVDGHPALKPVRFSRSHAAQASKIAGRPEAGVTEFYRVDGEEVHEVAVGPVHAGVIEPGHFRFQCHGEHVFHLEIALGYQHRGVERALIGGPNRRSIHYMETLAGDTSVGHTLAYCQAMEALGEVQTTARANVLRGIALELERLANHTGDLGALANDVAYLPTASFCGRLRGDFLNMTAMVCGSRFGRGWLRPGGVGFDIDPPRRDALVKRLEASLRDVKSAVNLLWDTPSVMARFEDAGRVSREVCERLGLVGPAARACGVGRDVRHDHAFGVFRFAHVPVSTWHSGDVFARAYVRWLEIQRSTRFILDRLASLPAGDVRSAERQPAGDRMVVSLVEGWRGEICHVAITDSDGRFLRYKVVDPSFHNWTGLAMALRGQAISDFPLCNKSFNLSYCGHDL